MRKVFTAVLGMMILLMSINVLATESEGMSDSGINLDDVLNRAEETGFCYTFWGDNQNFDGNRVLNGTEEEISRLKSSAKGTILVRYKTAQTTDQVLFAAGKDYSRDSYGAILANNVSGISRQRIDYPNGMRANLDEYEISEGWHTFVYSVDASEPGSVVGKTVTSFDGSETTQYPDYASWYNANSSVNDIQYLTIGGADGTFEDSGNNSNFTGQLAFVAFIPETFTQSEAAALSSAQWPATIFSQENMVINSESEAVEMDTEILGKLAGLDSASVIIQYKNTGSGVGSLLGISDPDKVNHYFSLFQNGDAFGFEYRNNDDPQFLMTSDNVIGNSMNTVAFKAESGIGYQLFANGVAGPELHKGSAEYQFLSDLSNLTAGYVGKTLRTGGAGNYPFTGEILSMEIYPAALPDEYLLSRTAETTINPEPEAGEAYQVFYHGDATGSTFFRIPFLLRTADDTLIAGTDANFGSAGDSAENIDAAIRIKPDASDQDIADGWNDATVPDSMHMRDYTDEVGYRQQSASYIDGVIVEDTAHTDRVIIVIDAFPWNGGVFSYLNINSLGEAKGGTNRSVAYGDGFCTIDGKKYLLLSSQNIKGSDSHGTDNINHNTVRANFDYAADVYGDKNADGRYNIYRLQGVPNEYSGAGDTVDDSNLSIGELSEYSLDQDYALYKAGTMLTVKQKLDDHTYSETDVPMNVFYEDSELQLYHTSYLMQFYSDDNGVTWHKDKIISGMVKPDNSRYFVTGPGRGIQLKNGDNAGRILLPIYCQLSNVSGIGTPATAIIYSDDGGVTWETGNVIPSSLGLHESALVEMPNGSVKIFVRNTSGSGGKFITATSIDGGENWIDAESVFGDNSAGTNCQISALNLSAAIADPDEPSMNYPAIVMASANNSSRTNGKIWTGLIKENGAYENGMTKYTIDWAYEYEVTGASELFAYSCMTEMANGDVGLLYEASSDSTWSTGLQGMYYNEFPISELTAGVR